MSKRLSWNGSADRRWGPFLVSRSHASHGFSMAAISLDEERHSQACFRLLVGEFCLMAALPNWLVPPERKKVPAVYWDAATIERMGRDWYWQITERKFGISYFDGLLSIYYGRQTDSSKTEARKSWFLPWTQWRHVRQSFLNPKGDIVRTFWDKRLKNRDESFKRFTERYEYARHFPKTVFRFADYDGERIDARCHIEEREWRFGEGMFKWLSWLRKPKIHRYIEIQFSAEVGERKGSWKGGTIGHSGTIVSGQTIEEAFREYCDKNNLVFIGEVDPAEQIDWKAWSDMTPAIEKRPREDYASQLAR